MSESAVRAKRGRGWFGAQPAQSETPARAAMEAASNRKRAQWGSKKRNRKGRYLADSKGWGRFSRI